MWKYNHTDELYHWGVKGMKWGIRKKVVETAKETAPKFNKPSEPHPNKPHYKSSVDQYKSYARSNAMGAAIISGLIASPFAGMTVNRLGKKLGIKGSARARIVMGTMAALPVATGLAVYRGSTKKHRVSVKNYIEN